MVALQSLLRPQVLTKVVSQKAATSDWLAMLFGVQPGGRNIMNYGHGRDGAYHIYNHVRAVAQGRAPGTASARRAAQPVGRVPFTYPRMHDSVSLNAEVLHNLGRLDNPAARDSAGANMISRQTASLAELAANWRKAMLVGTLRDSLYVGREGDDEWFQFASAGAAFRLHGRMPAGNQGQLDMTGAGNIIDETWSATGTDIPNQLMGINAGFQELCGGHLGAIICTHKQWNNVLNNEHVAAIHGSAAAPFRTLTVDGLDPLVANTMLNVYRATLNAFPNLIWYVTDEGIEIGKPGEETYTKIVEDDKAIFVGFEPGQDVFGCYEGSEPIAEYDNGPETVKVGLSTWSVKRSNPTSTDIFALDNALCVNHVPNSIAYGTVEF